jgi:hypothetical protein
MFKLSSRNPGAFTKMMISANWLDRTHYFCLEYHCYVMKYYGLIEERVDESKCSDVLITSTTRPDNTSKGRLPSMRIALSTELSALGLLFQAWWWLCRPFSCCFLSSVFSFFAFSTPSLHSLDFIMWTNV